MATAWGHQMPMTQTVMSMVMALSTARITIQAPNPGQDDFDLDGVGEVCDDCFDPMQTLSGSADNCSRDFNPDQADADADGLGDVCDLDDANEDYDGDGITDGAIIVLKGSTRNRTISTRWLEEAIPTQITMETGQTAYHSMPWRIREPKSAAMASLTTAMKLPTKPSQSSVSLVPQRPER